MENPKLKRTHVAWTVSWLVLVAGVIATNFVFGEQAFYWVLGVLSLAWTLIHLAVMARTGNTIYLVTAPYFLFMGLTFLPPLQDHSLRLVFAIGAASLLVPFFWVLTTKRINWRYREILELAAKPVKDTANGFTARPYPAGQTEHTAAEIRSFSQFLLKHVIAYPVYEDGRVILVIPRYMFVWLFGLRRDYTEETHVAFDDSGEMSVRISEKDYRTYKDELTFDQLCASLAGLFVGFLESHRTGRSREIIATLNSV